MLDAPHSIHRHSFLAAPCLLRLEQCPAPSPFAASTSSGSGSSPPKSTSGCTALKSATALAEALVGRNIGPFSCLSRMGRPWGAGQNRQLSAVAVDSGAGSNSTLPSMPTKAQELSSQSWKPGASPNPRRGWPEARTAPAQMPTRPWLPCCNHALIAPAAGFSASRIWRTSPPPSTSTSLPCRAPSHSSRVDTGRQVATPSAPRRAARAALEQTPLTPSASSS
mmetsp:Transcript_67507/g.187153  ORF Transcript_67507/g.187153 Transcript_67507/m.187153 type:complete len:223 (+) Transcript_67507:491-1159(+)